MKIRVLYILLFGLVTGNLMGQGSVTANFQVALQTVIEQYEQENEFPGVTAAVDMHEFGLFQGASGFSYGDVEMDTSMLVGVASNTKLFTSVICVMMAEHGYFDLDDPLGDWVDSVRFVDPAITVRQLLQHSSGLNDFIENSELFPGQFFTNPTKIWTPEETLTYIFEPFASPGEEINYSNANYLLAAMVLEAATEMKYVDLVRDSIITPLGLEDIYFEGFEEIADEMAHPFLFGLDFSENSRIALGTATWAAGCMVSKPKTLIKWYDHLFSRNFLAQEQLAQIMNFVEWPNDPLVDEVGLGLFKLRINDRDYYGHGGRTIGYTSYSLFDVECGHTISLAINDGLADAMSLAVLLAEKACELANMPSSVENIDDAFRVYPNPASDRIYFDGASELNLYDSSGMLQRSSDNSNFLDVSTLVNGFYFIHANTEKGKLTKKVLIQH